MTHRSRCALAALSILATAALATTAEAQPRQMRGPRTQPLPVTEIRPEMPDVTLDTPAVSVENPTVEQPEETAVSSPVAGEPTADHQNLPPGLQRQVDGGRGLPPGLQRQVDSGRGLPPGLQRSR
ncbi:MAG: hypothetical protein EA368_13635 [Leptolyngbya sp. DLM2.Bin27]|nr:MAG: hypothetical protein EA368_13635 [Leptolyngbya sp. DLM2.Bin27]